MLYPVTNRDPIVARPRSCGVVPSADAVVGQPASRQERCSLLAEDDYLASQVFLRHINAVGDITDWHEVCPA